MSIAATTHRANGPLSAKGGFELPLTDLAAAGLLTKMLTAKPAVVVAASSQPEPVSEPQPDQSVAP